MSNSILVPLGGDPSFSPLWGGAPCPSPLPLSYPCGLNGLCGSGKFPWDFPAGGRPCDGPSIPCELTFILVMIPLARLPLWHPAMPSKIPIICLFPYEIGLGWKCLSSPFRHIGLSAHWSLQGEGAWGLPLPNRGCPWDSSGPGLSLIPPSAVLCHHYGYFSRGGGVMTPPSCPGLCFQWGSHLIAPSVPPAPLVGLGGPLVGLPWALVLPVGSTSFVGY